MEDKQIEMRHPPEGGVECTRTVGGPITSVKRIVVQHSSDGFEWGYAGSGPADLALNILAHFLPILGSPHPLMTCFKGKVSKEAWDLHQDFKYKFIACMPEDGGFIAARDMKKWIDKNLKLKGLR